MKQNLFRGYRNWTMDPGMTEEVSLYVHILEHAIFVFCWNWKTSCKRTNDNQCLQMLALFNPISGPTSIKTGVKINSENVPGPVVSLWAPTHRQVQSLGHIKTATGPLASPQAPTHRQVQFLGHIKTVPGSLASPQAPNNRQVQFLGHIKTVPGPVASSQAPIYRQVRSLGHIKTVPGPVVSSQAPINRQALSLGHIKTVPGPLASLWAPTHRQVQSLGHIRLSLVSLRYEHPNTGLCTAINTYQIDLVKSSVVTILLWIRMFRVYLYCCVEVHVSSLL
jgi:hypothetical protein